MRRITRSQYHLEMLDSFIESDKSKIYLDLYPREVDCLSKRYYGKLNFTMVKKVMAHEDDERYHCLVEKI